MLPPANETATAAQRGPDGAHAFPTTRWSVVLRAQEGDSMDAARALEILCQTYWKPVYAFLRRQGHPPHDAEDLAQGFFAMLLERGSLADVEESRGRLRSFLLVAVKRFAVNEHERATALKRGGGVDHVPWDLTETEQSLTWKPMVESTAEMLFDRQWALSLLGTVLARMRAEYAADSRTAVFEVLKDRLSTDGDAATLAQRGIELGMTEGALKVAVWRMRQRYRKLLHDEIARTVQSPDEVKAEILYLFKVLG